MVTTRTGGPRIGRALVPLQAAYGRYQAVPTRGGETVVTLRYQPAWRAPALLLFAMGGLAVLVLALRR